MEDWNRGSMARIEAEERQDRQDKVRERRNSRSLGDSYGSLERSKQGILGALPPCLRLPDATSLAQLGGAINCTLHDVGELGCAWVRVVVPGEAYLSLLVKLDWLGCAWLRRSGLSGRRLCSFY